MQPNRHSASLMGMDTRLARSTDLPRDLVIDVHTAGLRQVVTVSGDLDLHTAPLLRLELLGQIRRGHDHIVVDLDQVTFLDSVALGVLVGARTALADVDGTLEIVCGNPGRLRIFQITGLDVRLAVSPGLVPLG